MRDSLIPEQAPGSGPRSPQGASTPADGAREGRDAHAASQGPSGASADYDRDPEAIAWARKGIQHSIDKAERFSREADTPERREQWRLVAWYMRSELIGSGEGCVITRFDERLPAHRARMDRAVPLPTLVDRKDQP